MIKQAIVTKYLPATNYKGARIKATASSGSVTIPYPHHVSSNDCYKLAAMTLAKKFGWYGEWIAGGLDKGEVFVQGPGVWDDIAEEVVHSEGFALPRPFTIPADEIVLFALNTGKLHDVFCNMANNNHSIEGWEAVIKKLVLKYYQKDARVPQAHFTPSAIKAAAIEIRGRHLEMIKEEKQPTRAEVRATLHNSFGRSVYFGEYQNKDGTWAEVLDAYGQRCLFNTRTEAFAAARRIVG